MTSCKFSNRILFLIANFRILKRVCDSVQTGWRAHAVRRQRAGSSSRTEWGWVQRLPQLCSQVRSTLSQRSAAHSLGLPPYLQRRSREKVELSNFAVTFDDDAPFSLSIAYAMTKFNFRVPVTTIDVLLTRWRAESSTYVALIKVRSMGVCNMATWY